MKNTQNSLNLAIELKKKGLINFTHLPLYKEELGYGAQIIEPLQSIVSPKEIESEEELALVNSDTSKKVFEALINEIKDLEEITKDNLKVAFKNHIKRKK